MGHTASAPSFEIEFFIPGLIPSPNVFHALGLRRQMRAKRAMRERAFYAGLTEIRAGRARPILGPADVAFCAHRARRLDPSINLPASLKWIQDGLSTCEHRPPHPRGQCPDLILPLGDGVASPYRFTFEQVVDRDEGVRVRIWIDQGGAGVQIQPRL